MASSTRGAHSWVRNTPTGLPDCTSIVSSAVSVVSVRAIASNASQLRAAWPVPPYTTRSSGRSATSGSRLLCSMRYAASCGQPRHVQIGAARGADRTGDRRHPCTRPPAGRSRLRRRRARCRRRAAARRRADRATASDRRPGPATRVRSDVDARRAVAGAGGSGRAQIERGAGAHQLDGEHAAQVVDAATQLARRCPAVRHVVLLHRAGRQRLHAGRHGQPLVLERHRRLRVVGDHQAAVDAGVGRQERRQPVRAGDVEHAVGAPLGDRRQLRRRRSPGSRTRSPTGAPWKLPQLSTRPSGRIIGLSMAASSSRSAIVRAWASVSSAAPCTCGVQRSEYASCTRESPTRWLATIAEPASMRVRLRALTAWPDLRSQRLQVGGERTVGAEQRLRPSSPAVMSASAQQRRQVVRAPGTACRACRRCR